MNNYCIITGLLLYDKHHVKSKGSGGGENSYNIMNLTREKHQEVHCIGLTQMSKKYKSVKKWLIENNWYFCEIQKRWKH